EKAEDLIQLKELFKGDFLEGLYLRNCNDFNEMILFERVVCQNKQVEVLEKLIGLYEQQGRFEEELQVLNEVAAIEPYNEQFAHRAIQIYGKLGNRTAAINYYKNFEIVLRRNLNTSPNNELKLLYKELLESSCSGKYEEKGNAGRGKKEINIKITGLKEIPYFGIENIIDSIMNSAEKKYLFELNSSDIKDLSYIHSGFGSEYAKLVPDFPKESGQVPSVRITHAFLRLLEHVSERYVVRIQIKNLEEMDVMSQKILLYIEKMKYPNIEIQY
ncbi:MAG: bacterial transcriptional activator domain-containing protein, partial [Bacillota bacterium]